MNGGPASAWDGPGASGARLLGPTVPSPAPHSSLFCFLEHLPSLLPRCPSPSSPRLGRVVCIPGLLCDHQALPCPLCASPAASRSLLLPPPCLGLNHGGLSRTGVGVGGGRIQEAGDRLQDSAWGWGPCLPTAPFPATGLCGILASMRGTDCCRLATGLAPRKPKKAVDARLGVGRAQEEAGAPIPVGGFFLDLEASGRRMGGAWGETGRSHGNRLCFLLGS